MNRDAGDASRVRLGLFVNRSHLFLILETLKIDREMRTSVSQHMPKAYTALFKQRRRLKQQLKSCRETFKLVLGETDVYEKESR